MHGDYPHGAYWSAERRDQDDEGPEDYTVDGQVIRLMWDYGVRVPLWDAAGLLPEEPEWLRVALGLSDGLINDLNDWGHDMNWLDGAQVRSRQYDALDLRARELADRLQRELGSRFTVRTSRPASVSSLADCLEDWLHIQDRRLV